MSLGYIRRRYGVPARRGKKVRVWGGDIGVIVGSSDGWIKVRVGKDVFPCHPTWEIEYLDEDGDVEVSFVGSGETMRK